MSFKISDWQLEATKRLTPSLSTDAVILGESISSAYAQQPSSVWVNTVGKYL